MKIRSFATARALTGLLACILLAVAGCEAPNPKANTPTSGRLIVIVDEQYAPLIRTLADTFMVRSPNAKLELRIAPARMAVQELLDAWVRDTSRADTSASYAIIIGRELLPDEEDAILKAGIDNKEYMLAYDGLAVAVPAESPLGRGTLEGLRRALNSRQPTYSMIDSTAGDAPVRFLFTDQNSSSLAAVRSRLLSDSNVAAPARYFSTADSVVAATAAGEGIGVIGWWRAHNDSVNVRTLPLGFIDSTGGIHPPAIVHPTSLVTDAYPLKQSVVGYTFAANRSLAVGFLAWLARSQDAQHYLGRQGLQPANVKIRIVMPASE